MTGSHTIVVGGGIVGLSCAYFLARRGRRVTLIERDAIGDGASGGNAGNLVPGHPPLPHPGLPGQLLRLAFDSANPLYVRPRLDPALLRWAAGFRRACSPRAYERGFRVLAEVGRPALECLRRLIEDERIDCEFGARGFLKVCRTAREFEHGRAVAERMRGFGYRVDELPAGALREREPAFVEGLAGAWFFADAAFADPRRFVLGLADRVRALGVTVLTGTAVTGIDAAGGRFRAVSTDDGETREGDGLVLAAGAWTAAIARKIGLRIPLQPGKGYHVDLRDTPARPSTTCVLAESYVAVTPIRGGLRLAGTIELAGLDLTVTRHRMDRLRAGARDGIRGIDDAGVASEWCGLRPMTPDGLPAVGPASRVDGVHVATGHGMRGFLLGTATGRWISEEILDGAASADLSALRPDRF